jgi:hypothetical protein
MTRFPRAELVHVHDVCRGNDDLSAKRAFVLQYLRPSKASRFDSRAGHLRPLGNWIQVQRYASQDRSLPALAKHASLPQRSWVKRGICLFICSINLTDREWSLDRQLVRFGESEVLSGYIEDAAMKSGPSRRPCAGPRSRD